VNRRRTWRRKRFRGELAAALCSRCGEPILFVDSRSAPDPDTDYICPSCAAPMDGDALTMVERNGLALDALLKAHRLRQAADPAERTTRRAMADVCENVAEELAALSSRLVPPTA
jgi:hypothetical protein